MLCYIRVMSLALSLALDKSEQAREGMGDGDNLRRSTSATAMALYGMGAAREFKLIFLNVDDLWLTTLGCDWDIVNKS